MRFSGKTVVVTGAGIGIGYAICRAFAQEGANVTLSDVDGALAERSAVAINQEIGADRVCGYACDVADVGGVRAMIGAVVERFGGVDIAIANAGITLGGAFLEYEPDDFDRLMSVNLRGSYFTAQAAARAMVAQGRGGRILFMSSVTGVRAFANLGTYGISKAALQKMTSTLAFELGEHKITVNCVAPGATLTERTLQSSPHYEQGWAGMTPLKQVARVEDIASAMLFFASPEAHHITGQTLVIDGGWSLYSPLPEDE